MNESRNPTKIRRVVTVPQPILLTGQLPPNRPLDVELAEGEVVEWLWSPLPGGQQYISGYRIVKSR